MTYSPKGPSVDLRQSLDEDIDVSLRRQREALRLTQQELAARLGVSFATINRWEQGHAQPSRANLAKLSRLFGSPRSSEGFSYSALLEPYSETRMLRTMNATES